MVVKKHSGVNVRLKDEYKLILDKASWRLSDEVDERVPITKIIYRLIDDHLEDAIQSLKEEY